MFVLRLIFSGLIALVPIVDQQGKEQGMTLLLLKADHHKPIVGMIVGQCVEGDCARPAGSTPQPAGSTPLGLYWKLVDEGLSLTLAKADRWQVPATTKLTGGCPLMHFPENVADTADRGWILRLDDLFPGKGKIDPDCLGERQHCPIVARFTVHNGQLSACHLVHGEMRTPTGTTLVMDDLEKPIDMVAAFSFGGTDLTPRAIADAVMVEIEVAAPYLELESRSMIDGSLTRAKLEPVDGKMTLVVSNNDFHRPPTGKHEHFEHYYELAQIPEANKVVPSYFGEIKLDPGSCENDLEEFEKKLDILGSDAVHNYRECDTLLFSP